MSFPFMKPLIDVPHDMSFPFRGELSDLPDKILHEIVSHLPSKDAVKCRILSRQWQEISKYSRNLDFDSQREGGELDANLDLRMSFLQFVHWVFIFNEAETIERFHLRCHENYNVPEEQRVKESHFHMWINSAVSKKVKKVELDAPFSVPSRLLNCPTVEVLKLQDVALSRYTSMNLPEVRVLHIGDGVYCRMSQYVLMLLRACPLLEELVLNNANYCYSCMSSTSKSKCMCCPNDINLDIKRSVRVKVGFSWKINCGMGKVFQALCKVERLSISSITVQCLVDHSHRDIPRSFDNLLELEISFKDSHWNLLLKLLQRSPKLERLVIHKESNSSATPKLKKLPALPLVLKVFAFNNCEGSEDDLGFIECMLQNAEGLERMRIDFASSTDSHTQNQTAEKVSSFSRRSTNCQLKFNHIP